MILETLSFFSMIIKLMAQPTRRFYLKWSKLIAPKVRQLAFQLEDKSNIAFTAGQFVTLNIEGPTKTLHRSYSVANAPHSNTLEIACAFVEGGVASTLLFNMQEGESLLANGPFGLFVLKEEHPARYVFIATGTGVTPYRSMLNDLQARLTTSHPELEIILILGVRNRTELLFAEEFNAFAKMHPNFKFYACYSQEPLLADQQPFERLGRVQSIFPDLNLDPNQDIIYLCGNPHMIDENFALLTNMGFDKKNIRREKYVFSH